MKNTIKILAAAVVMISVVSCQKDTKPNYQYMPNMYESVGYETYGEYGVFGENGQEAKLPAEGSIPRGWMPYDFENSNEGYQLAKDTLKNPIRYTKENEEKGKELYNIYCAICHGDKGNGKGTLVKREKILGVPSYDDAGRAITEGSIYHVMYYGINSMGSYASQTNEHERWQIVQYVEKLKADLEGKTPRIDADVAIVETEKIKEDHHTATEEDHHESTEEHSNAH
ncbi:cytochrome c [Aquimarina sp. AD10]|uniref:Cytochrome C n=1 Tax=Aquimarina aggregata TaxID=1642818 RepID=A0A162YRW7_9FLAO|nr:MULTISPECIES: cytochrome c [Aquimarina]AXT61216.1 cytochrome c [Aquimarina sp. AD10]KZS39313.1 cytochrome C [Aquimarina aggregata]RKN02167.1 cytochrome c [Aquimarina sp. AD10]